MSGNLRRWTWACASHIGTSHLKTGQRLQDAFSCFSCSSEGREYFVGIVSDGAGSAEFGGQGAALACRSVGSAIRRHFAASLGLPTQTSFEYWLDDARDRIYRAAQLRAKEARDFAATLVCVISDGEESFFAHIGDGCAVVRDCTTGEWLAGTWPDHGEYASTTTFITDEPVAKLRVANLACSIDVISLFSDGIERMVLDMATRKPAAQFFGNMAPPVLSSVVDFGKDSRLSGQLKEYLGSAKVTDKTDDDKTLVIAALR